MATEVEQLYLQLELINIEEQMLILQMLKRRRQIRRVMNGGAGTLKKIWSIIYLEKARQVFPQKFFLIFTQENLS